MEKKGKKKNNKRTKKNNKNEIETENIFKNKHRKVLTETRNESVQEKRLEPVRGVRIGH